MGNIDNARWWHCRHCRKNHLFNYFLLLELHRESILISRFFHPLNLPSSTSWTPLFSKNLYISNDFCEMGSGCSSASVRPAVINSRTRTVRDRDLWPFRVTPQKSTLGPLPCLSFFPHLSFLSKTMFLCNSSKRHFTMIFQCQRLKRL